MSVSSTQPEKEHLYCLMARVATPATPLVASSGIPTLQQLFGGDDGDCGVTLVEDEAGTEFKFSDFMPDTLDHSDSIGNLAAIGDPRTSNPMRPACCRELPGSANDRSQHLLHPTMTRITIRMAIVVLPLRFLTTTTTLTGRAAPTHTASTTTGAQSFPSSAPSPMTPTLVPLLGAKMRSTTRVSRVTRAPRSHVLSLVRTTHAHVDLRPARGNCSRCLGHRAPLDDRCTHINHPAKGPAPPGSILSRCSLVFMLFKKIYIYIYIPGIH